MLKTVKSAYETGDIVYVSKYSYSNGKQGTGHLFVIIDIEENKMIPIEYFGMLISSHIDKSSEKSKYKYNLLLNKTKSNGLRDNSIVKCDEIYSISPKNIMFKIGAIDVDDYIRFINAYVIS